MKFDLQDILKRLKKAKNQSDLVEAIAKIMAEQAKKGELDLAKCATKEQLEAKLKDLAKRTIKECPDAGAKDLRELATREDLRADKAELKAEIRDLRTEMKEDMEKLRTEIRASFRWAVGIIFTGLIAVGSGFGYFLSLLVKTLS